jgi:hypothetical protein
VQGQSGAGSPGAQGVQGQAGPTGVQGARGAQGDTGTGAPGAQGVQGVVGPSGAQGVQGANGPPGAQGVQGPVGTGAPGAQGAQGLRGAQGDQGVQGAAAAPGAQGIQGTAGSPGAQGVQGAPGTGIVSSGAATYIAYYSTTPTGTTISAASGGATIFAGGDIQAADFVVASDERLKNVIENIPNALDIINNLDGIKYTWNELAQRDFGYDGNHVELGVLAQQLEALLPELILPSAIKDYKTVAYHRLVAVLIEAVKELTKRVETLESK